ncbi:hypothetical protein H6G54_11630 [Anabaena cylindrica FACHB-243]|uniref:Uncharacterized protein n=1 Tax=Anabaena cylindrica (strain ATCC 27899 / PCC 7122) TaxID=272123 RepID=K9ZP07_ANACC|nr:MULTISPECIES: hypothetical protein [Anabaena]AFZ60529.1 hypothetical protein Anacy_5199 [Anabaena cylindrica PCC 7122]MBD2418338.1 hypothetical protein [Anabaena cylindrica FACHB-243]MBY5285689.1 hypothetical protein [Anabaena sp. CCAP 1446/1C]MBY5308980.1 hypothetical protein [Anabaena sp. CCAP 1446/1C]MCM2409970.1 hypothetical protein [Anabaena sp. CCAP 1446/1C]
MNRIYTQQSSFIPFSFIGQFGRKIRIIQAGVFLFLAFPLWLATEAIAPQIVQAYTARVDLTIDRLPAENYETVLRRAEAVARAAAQRSFDQDILVTDVSIIVSVQNYGAIAPVIALDVSRLQWKQRPDPQRWVTYFKTARSLLFFEQQTPVPDAAPAVPPTTATPPTVKEPTQP